MTEQNATEPNDKKRTITEDEEKQLFSHPFFARTAEEMEGNPAFEALQAIKFESEDSNCNAENFKEEGNYYVKQKDYEKAVIAYTGGISAKPTDSKLLAILYTNRAIANGLIKNHGSCVKDCKWAIKQDPNHLKAYIQAAKSLLILSKPSEASQMCDSGLKISPSSEILAGLKAKAVTLELLKAEQLEQKQATVSADNSKLSNAYKQVASRGIKIDFKQPPVGLPESTGVEITFDHLNLIHWPVLVMYPEFSMTDFVQDVAEFLTVRETLKHVLSPSNPPPWDREKAYITSEDEIEVYFEDNTVQKQMVEVPISRTITELTRCPGASQVPPESCSSLGIASDAGNLLRSIHNNIFLLFGGLEAPKMNP